MNEENFDPNDVTETLRQDEHDDQFDVLAEGLAALSPNWKVSIQRVAPSWCKGHLETIDVYDPADHGIDMDYLIRKWGGRKLWIRILNEKGQYKSSGTINLFSFPPRVNGTEIREHEVYGMSPEQNPNRPTYQPMQYQPQQQQQQGLGLDITKLIDIISKKGGAGADASTILQIMEYARSNQQPQMQLNTMMEQMMGMMGVMSQMRQLFGDGGGGGGGGGSDDSFSPIVGELAKALINRQPQQPQQMPPRGALAPPRRQFQASPPPQSKPVSKPQTDTLPNDEQDVDIVEDLADKLAALDVDDAAEAAMMAIDSMPEEKRNAVMRAFLTMGERRQLDDSSTMTDTNRQGHETTD